MFKLMLSIFMLISLTSCADFNRGFDNGYNSFMYGVTKSEMNMKDYIDKTSYARIGCEPLMDAGNYAEWGGCWSMKLNKKDVKILEMILDDKELLDEFMTIVTM